MKMARMQLESDVREVIRAALDHGKNSCTQTCTSLIIIQHYYLQKRTSMVTKTS